MKSFCSLLMMIESIPDDAYYDAITAKLRQIQGQVQYSTLYKQYLSKTHTRRREWLSNNADLNLYGILQELPFMAGKEFVSSKRTERKK